MLSVYVNIWVILLLALTDSYYVWVGTPGVDREVGAVPGLASATGLGVG